MPRKVVFIPPPEPALSHLWHEEAAACAKHHGFDVVHAQRAQTSESHWQHELADAVAIITSWGSPRLDESTLPLGDELKIIAHAAGSVAPYVSPIVFERGIRVVTMNKVMAQSVAEYCLMATLMGLRGMDTMARISPDTRPLPMAGLPVALGEACVGIWGWGDVAKRLVALLKATGTHRIMVCNDYLSKEEAASMHIEKVTFDDMFQHSDVVHLVESLRPDTRGQVQSKHLAAMRCGATLVMAGRAHLVVEEDLVHELSNARIHAIIDVHYAYDGSRALGGNLSGLPNVTLTPHYAGRAGRRNYLPIIFDEIDRCMNGLPLEHEISAERAAAMSGFATQ